VPLGPVSGRVRDGEILVWVSEGIWRGSEFCWSSIGSGKAGGPSPKPPSVRLYPIPALDPSWTPFLICQKQHYNVVSVKVYNSTRERKHSESENM